MKITKFITNKSEKKNILFINSNVAVSVALSYYNKTTIIYKKIVE